MDAQQLKWEYGDTSIEMEHVKLVEVEIGHKFPQDFVECILAYNGCQPFPYSFDFGKRKGVVFGNLISFHPFDDGSFLDTYEDLKETLPQGIIPFADDPAGNYICFDFLHPNESGEPKVVFWYHEFALTQDDFHDLPLSGRGGLTYDEFLREEAIRPICGSFTELLSMLHESDDEE